MKFTFVYHKETDTWDFSVGEIQFTLTREDLTHLDFLVGVELISTDPGFEAWVKENSK